MIKLEDSKPFQIELLDNIGAMNLIETLRYNGYKVDVERTSSSNRIIVNIQKKARAHKSKTAAE